MFPMSMDFINPNNAELIIRDSTFATFKSTDSVIKELYSNKTSSLFYYEINNKLSKIGLGIKTIESTLNNRELIIRLLRA